MESWVVLLILGAFFVFFLGILVFGVVTTVVFTLVSSTLRRRQTMPEWQAAAEELGLQFDTNILGAPRLKGVVNGVPIEIYNATAEVGPESTDRPLMATTLKRQIRTFYTVELNPPWDEATFTQNDWQSGLVLDAVGMKDFHTGDPEFDDAIRIRGSVSRELAARLADDRIRQALLELAEKFLLFQISGGTLLVQLVGSGNSTGELTHHIESVTEAASILNAGRDSTPPRQTPESPQRQR